LVYQDKPLVHASYYYFLPRLAFGLVGFTPRLAAVVLFW
jgi:hypothetical protein